VKDNNFDNIIKSELINEVTDIKMSEELRGRIIKNTIRKPDTLIEKIRKLLDRSIEIPIASAIAGCTIALMVFCFPILNNSIKEYSSGNDNKRYEIVNAGGFQIVFDTKKEVNKNENRKN
jgi:hypothetical protein